MTEDWIDIFERHFTHWNWADSLSVVSLAINSAVFIFGLLYAPWWGVLIYSALGIVGIRWSLMGLRTGVARRRHARQKVLEWRQNFPKQEWPVT